MNPQMQIEFDLTKFKRTLKQALILLLVLVLLGVGLSQLMFVREDEYMVIRSWTGRVQRIVTEAGLAAKLPFIESSQSLPKHKRVYEGSPRDILTTDQKPVIVDHYTVWQITDPLKFVQNTQSVSNAEQRIDAAVYSIVRTTLGTMRYDEIVSEGSARGDVNAQVTAAVNESLARGDYGITVLDVRMKRIDLPEQNLNSVYNRMRSDRVAMAAEYTSQGEEEAMKIIAATDREAREITSQAEREALEIIAEGEAEAARIYNEAYGADPEFYAFYRTLESYKTTLQGKPTIVIPIDSPYAQLLLGN